MSLGEQIRVKFPPVKNADSCPFTLSILNFIESGLFKICSYNKNYLEFSPSQPDHIGTHAVTI